MDNLNDSISASRARMGRLATSIEESTNALRGAQMWMQLEQTQLEHLLARRADERPHIEWSWIPLPAWN